MTTSENLKLHVSIVLSLSAIKGYKYVCAELNSLVLSEIDAECGLSEWTQCVPAVDPSVSHIAGTSPSTATWVASLQDS